MVSFDRVCKAVYEAALLPSRTPQMMRSLIAAFDADAASLHMQDLSDNVASKVALEALDPSCETLYLAEFADDNPLIDAAMPGMTGGTVNRVGDLMPEREYLKTRYYNEFWRPFDGRHVLGACVIRERDVMSALTLIRRHHVADFSNDHVALMRRLVPHLQRAVLVRRELGIHDLATVAAWEALERSGIALMTLDRLGQAVLITGCARQLCDRADGLRLTGSGLRALDPTADAALQRAQALARFGGAAIPILTVPRTFGKPYRVLIVGIPPIDAAEPGPSVLVLIRAPDVHVPPHLGLLRELFGLTFAETRLVHTLIGGDTVQDHADRTDTRLHTVRSQLRSVFEKTDTASQAALCRLVARAAIGAKD